ncbi:MAG: glycerol-3-phosphate 1-O-acyltransferase PlsY [Chloroflexi bacterium]|nr:glycerol-3-phosphate 1-O-acyltransferase PlsY [Chloroflexota bacterium]
MGIVLFVVLLPLAYLWGSVPWGLLVARLTRGVDVREYGSGKIGMTNVMRTAGVRAAVVVLLLDLGKGAAAPLAARGLSHFLSLAPTLGGYLEMSVGLATLVGHNWSVFIGFQGGRGTATGLGALAVLSPWSALMAVSLGVPAIFLSRYVSLGSLLGASSGGLATLVLSLAGVQPLAYGLYGAIGGPIVVIQHRANIQRILRGTEHRIGQAGRRLARPVARRDEG